MNMHKRLSPVRFRELFLAHDELPAAEPVDAPHRRVAERVLVDRPTQRGLRARRARPVAQPLGHARVLAGLRLLHPTGSEGTAMGAAPDVARRLVEVM